MVGDPTFYSIVVVLRARSGANVEHIDHHNLAMILSRCLFQDCTELAPTDTLKPFGYRGVVGHDKIQLFTPCGSFNRRRLLRGQRAAAASFHLQLKNRSWGSFGAM